MTGSNIV